MLLLGAHGYLGEYIKEFFCDIIDGYVRIISLVNSLRGYFVCRATLWVFLSRVLWVSKKLLYQLNLIFVMRGRGDR